MINSLIQDSHISQTLCHSQKGHDTHKNQNRCAQVERSKVKNERRDYFCATVNNQGITATKPAKISFSGLLSANLANSKDFKLLIESARKVVGNDKHQDKNVVALIKEAVNTLMPPATKQNKPSKSINISSEKVKAFLDSEKANLQKIIDETIDLTKKDNIVMINDPNNPKQQIAKMIPDPKNPSKQIVEYRLKDEEVQEDAIKSIGIAAEVFPIIGKKNSFLNSKRLENFLIKADKNNVAFSAGFALFLTCLLRPASIMALPGDKKHKDDKKYAAAHSIASGIIGYCVATAVSNPIAGALKKVLENPSNYMKNKHNALYIEASKKANECTKTWMTRGVDILLAVPKATITIALIPVILKYVFHWEKKKPNDDSGNSILQNYALLNFKSTSIPQKKVFQSFSGGAN